MNMLKILNNSLPKNAKANLLFIIFYPKFGKFAECPCDISQNDSKT